MNSKSIEIGIKLPDCKTIEVLNETLSRIEKDGFDFTEFHVDMFPLIIGGTVSESWTLLLKEEFKKHKLDYTAHIGRALDLRADNIKLHYSLFKSSIDVASILDVKTLVVHFECNSSDDQKEKQFKDYLKKGCLYAAEKNVIICLENIEVERIEPVVEIIAALNLKNLRMTLDTGHAFLASKYYHFDLMKALESTISYIAHIHLNDNTGVFEESRITNRAYYDGLEEGMRRELGMGDIHVPPFFGKVPFDEIFSLLKNYRGKFLCEYNSSSFIPLDRSICENVRAAILKAREE